MSGIINLKNILESVLHIMEIAEKVNEGKLTGEQKKEYVMNQIKEQIGELTQSYYFEIETIIETTIFLSKIGRKINVNNISKNCSGCFNFL